MQAVGHGAEVRRAFVFAQFDVVVELVVAQLPPRIYYLTDARGGDVLFVGLLNVRLGGYIFRSRQTLFDGAACVGSGCGLVFFDGDRTVGTVYAEFPPYYFDEFVPDDAFAEAT